MASLPPAGAGRAHLACAAALVALAMTVPVSAPGQTSDDALRRIAAAPDTAALDILRERLLEPLPDTAARRILLLGFVLLRRHELTGAGSTLDSARHAFERARSADDRQPLAQFGYGLALQRSPAVSGTLVATGRAWSRMLGFDDRAKARRAFERAVELEPGLTGAAVGLGELALQSQRPGELAVARDALARTLAARTADPLAVATLGRVAAALGDSVTALSVADRLMVADAASPALHALLWVLAPADGRENDVGEAFFRLVDGADAATLDRLHLELDPILTEREKTDWQEAGLEARRALLRNGWESRATLAGTTVAERIAEHWRRLGEAVTRFPRQVDGPPPPLSLKTSRIDSPFDDRGAIYVRHGEPDEVIWTWSNDKLTVGLTACPTSRGRRTGGNIAFRGNESWVYTNPDGSRVMYHFARCFDFPDYVLQDQLPCDGPWLAERAGYDIELTDCGPLRTERIRKQALAALATDSHRPRFDRQLPVIFDLLAFRGAGGRTDLLAPLAVAADSLTTGVAGSQTVYGVNFMLAVVDSGGAIARIDTTVLARNAGRLPAGHMLRTHVQLAAIPADVAQLRLTARGAFSDTEGSFYGTQMRVPDYGGDSLMVSSIVLATPAPSGSWRRGDHSLALMPLGQFEGGEFRVFFEIYNLEADRTYVTEVTVEPTGRRGPPPLRLRFQDFARPEPDGVVRDVRRVETGLPPGRYRITVQVTDPQLLRSTRADREFVVIERPDASGPRSGSTR